MTPLYTKNLTGSIDRLNGHPIATRLINSVDEAYISLVTYMEVMVGIDEADVTSLNNAHALFAALEIVGVDELKDLTIMTKRDGGGKLPDAIVHATALTIGAPLFTRDKGFRPVTFMKDIEMVRPYSSVHSPEELARILAAISLAENQTALIAILKSDDQAP